MPSPEPRAFICYADRPEPKFGLEPRFEALPKTGKSPNTPGNIMADAIMLLSQPINTLALPTNQFFTNIKIESLLMQSVFVSNLILYSADYLNAKLAIKSDTLTP